MKLGSVTVSTVSTYTNHAANIQTIEVGGYGLLFVTPSYSTTIVGQFRRVVVDTPAHLQGKFHLNKSAVSNKATNFN